MKKTTLRDVPPGLQARKWVERDERVISPSYTRAYPLVAASARGSVVTDVDGNRYLDFTSGLAVTATGHGHPKVVQSIRAQAGKLIHMSGTDFYHTPQIVLAETLSRLTGGGGGGRKLFLTNSGTEATEAAMKLARFATRRPYFISFIGAFHGRTFGSMSLSASRPIHRKGFSPLLPGILHAPYPNPYRPPAGIPPQELCDYVLSYIRDSIFRLVPPEEIAAIFVEPIQGEGGYIIPPPDFLGRLLHLAHEFGILLVVDEVQTGIGRTGKMFAYEHARIDPDMILIAKGIASGLPLGAMVAKRSLMTWESGAHANTFGGNPIACEAARVTLDLVENGLMQNAEKRGSFLMNRLRLMQKRHALIGDVRGMGLMIGIELVLDHKTKKPATQKRNDLVRGCFEHGLLVVGCGASTLRLIPPLVVTQAQIEEALGTLDDVLTEIEH